MKLIQSTADLTAVNQDKYWQLVRLTLEYVFHTDSGEAFALEQDIQNSPADEQLLFYHAEALSVAADLAETTPDEAQVQEYKTLRSQVYGAP